MAQQVYSKQALDRMSSPEAMNDYLHVTKPTVWIALAAVVLILVGAIVWAGFASVNSYATGTATVSDGVMTIELDHTGFEHYVDVGQKVSASGTETTVDGVNVRKDGSVIVTAHTDLSDGSYDAQVAYRETQILDILFN